MNLLFLGTSSGVPTKTRNVTGIAIRESEGSAWYLVDCGEGTQHQILHTGLSLNSLQAIFITHVHGDHCYGLPGILASAGMGGRKAPLQIIAPQGVKEWFQSTQINTELYLPFEIEFISTEALPSIDFKNIQVNCAELSHRVPSYGYSFTELHNEPNLNTEKLMGDGIAQGPIWGKLKNGNDVEYNGQLLKSIDYLVFNNNFRKIVVAGDNDQPELLAKICCDANLLVHEATYTKEIAEKIGKNVGHSYAGLVAQFAQSINIPNLILTHFSPRYQLNTNASPSIQNIYDEAKAIYSGNLYLASDFDEYSLNKAGDVALINER